MIHQDCRHFKGYVPCEPHKEHGVHCDGCGYYDKIGFNILIIKLDAVGDVLRTTCILQGLKEKYPDSHITWLTSRESLELFKNNDLVDDVIDYSSESFLRVHSERYNLVINPDASPKSAILAEGVRGVRKFGFGYHEKGHVYPFNKRAQKWFEMGLFDDIKKANMRTYQDILLDMINLKPSGYEIVLRLSDKEKKFAEGFAEKHWIKKDELKIGLNTGAGRRWKLKKWTVEGFSGLIKMINGNLPGARILLYGGPEENERNVYLSDIDADNLVDTGCENSLREFMSLIDICDILVTGDTTALHIAVALNKKVVALFGPTSYTEVDLYGRGKKIYPNIDCLCCYKQDCDKSPNCMSLITPETVFNVMKELI